MNYATLALMAIGVIFLFVAALTFTTTPVAALFYAAIGLALLIPEIVMDLGVKGAVITLPAAFGLAILAVVLQATGF